MVGISERQIQLLNAIINEYIQSAEPVGSVEVVEKYNFKFSPATARNEMARLLELGFLEMMHTSSGRIPTPMAYRYFLEELMEENELPVLQEVAMKQRLWPYRFDFFRLVKQAVNTLADQVKELAFITTKDGFVEYAGTVNILEYREFWDIDVAKTTLNLLDRYEVLESIFDKAPYGEDIRWLIGNEIGINNMKECAFVFAPYRCGKNSGSIGVIGPARMNYESTIPTLKYTKNLLEELGESW